MAPFSPGEAMPRDVPEWRGKTLNSRLPPRVQDRIYERFDGKCAACGRPLRRGHYDFDHIKALINGGENRENNYQPLCIVPCHQGKTDEDVAIKSKSYHRRTKHLGIRKSKHPIKGWKRFDNTPVRNPKLERGR